MFGPEDCRCRHFTKPKEDLQYFCTVLLRFITIEKSVCYFFFQTKGEIFETIYSNIFRSFSPPKNEIKIEFLGGKKIIIGISFWSKVAQPQFSAVYLLAPGSGSVKLNPCYDVCVVADPDLLWGQILKLLNANMPEEFYVWLSNLKKTLEPLLERALDLLHAAP